MFDEMHSWKRAQRSSRDCECQNPNLRAVASCTCRKTAFCWVKNSLDAFAHQSTPNLACPMKKTPSPLVTWPELESRIIIISLPLINLFSPSSPTLFHLHPPLYTSHLHNRACFKVSSSNTTVFYPLKHSHIHSTGTRCLPTSPPRA